MPQSRQLAAIMFTDIVGYTALMGKDEQKAFELLNKNRQLQKPVIEQYNGRWIKELGDGVMASFTTVSDAVNAAIKIQQTCNASKEFQLRIGIHLGEVVFENEDVFGDGVNIASRIQSIAEPGTIYISESVHHNVSNKQDINTQFVRQETLKNVKEPINIYEIITGLVSESPNSQVKMPAEKSPDKSIAVLPFVNMSNDSEQEYFCDGITEEMINILTMSGGLRVIARTSAFAFKNKFIAIQEIGRTLHVNYILEGSIRKAADKIRLNAKLVHVASGDHLWAGKYDRDLTDIFSIQEEIALSIAEQLKVLLQDRHLKAPTQNMEAFNYYLRGRHVEGKSETGWEKKSITLYEKAITIDPKFAAAHAAIALTSWILEAEIPQGLSEKITAHAQLALQLDNSNAEALAANALNKYHNEWKWLEAENEFIRAIQLNPYSVLSLHHFGVFLINMGRGSDALKILNRALQVDPLHTGVNQAIGYCYYTMGNYKLAKTQLGETLRIESSYFLAKMILGITLIELNEFNEAALILDSLPESIPFVNAAKFWLYTITKESKKASDLVTRLNDKMDAFPTYMAWMKIAIHDVDGAFQWLDRAMEKRDLMLICLPIFNWWDPIRKDTRFDEVLRKTGLAEYLKAYAPLPI